MSIFRTTRNAVRTIVRAIPYIVEKLGGVLKLTIRLFSASYLLAVACVPSAIALYAIVYIVQDPLHANPDAFLFLAGCIPIAYFLLLVAWRALTNTSSRADGGLLPPFTIQVFAICYGGIGLYGLIENLLAGQYLLALGGFVLVVGAAGVVLSSRLRELIAKSRQRQM